MHWWWGPGRPSDGVSGAAVKLGIPLTATMCVCVRVKEREGKGGEGIIEYLVSCGISPLSPVAYH